MTTEGTTAAADAEPPTPAPTTETLFERLKDAFAAYAADIKGNGAKLAEVESYFATEFDKIEVEFKRLEGDVVAEVTSSGAGGESLVGRVENAVSGAVSTVRAWFGHDKKIDPLPPPVGSPVAPAPVAATETSTTAAAAAPAAVTVDSSAGTPG